MKARAWFALAATWPIACTSAEPSAEPGSNAQPLTEPVAQAVPAADDQLVEELRIGGVDGPLEYTFGNVQSVAPAPDGSIYVGDFQVPVIRKYDGDGVHLFDVGRDGQGPGEYESTTGLGVAADESLILYDLRNTRLSRFGTDGDFIESVPVVNSAGGPRPLVYSRDGTVFVRVMGELRLVDDNEPRSQWDWARIGWGGGQERVAAIPPEMREGPTYVVSGNGGYYRPFTVMTLSVLGPDGSFYQVRNDEYRIRRTRPDGTTSELGREGLPIRVTSEETAQWEAFSGLVARSPRAQRADYLPIPAYKPFIRELRVDLDGRLWVSRYTEAVFMPYSEVERADREERGNPPHQWRDLPTWDVFSPDDEYLGSVTLPFKTSFVTAEGDLVWGIQSGDYDEEYVVRWRFEIDGAR